MPKYQVGKSKYAVEKVIQELGDGGDLQRVMDGHGLSAVQVMNMMGSKRGRELLKARRRLSKIHKELLAQRFSPFAVQKLCAVLQEKKPELWLKAAMAVLEVTKKGRGGVRRGQGGKGEEELEIENERAKELLRAMALGLEVMKGAEGMTKDKSKLNVQKLNG